MHWQQEVAALRGSGEWQQLLGELHDTAAGGPSVEALLRRAAASAEATSSSTAGTARLAEAVQQ